LLGSHCNLVLDIEFLGINCFEGGNSTIQAINRAVVQTAGAMQTDKLDITEWTARPSYEDEADEGTLDRL
jgi:hypothetical protein